ncbi:hypothetical protein ABZY14_10375, partial [Streptomyces sp. NPDC006617]|uniref:hypothetical protein n=1 Tax=Streptomyces sp. NPDC006617 TaxID=3155354 RepID=UPI0033AE34B4
MSWHTHGEDALGDTDGNTFEGPSTVLLLQVQVPLEGDVHGLEQCRTDLSGPSPLRFFSRSNEATAVRPHA